MAWKVGRNKRPFLDMHDTTIPVSNVVTESEAFQHDCEHLDCSTSIRLL